MSTDHPDLCLSADPLNHPAQPAAIKGRPRVALRGEEEGLSFAAYGELDEIFNEEAGQLHRSATRGGLHIPAISDLSAILFPSDPQLVERKIHISHPQMAKLSRSQPTEQRETGGGSAAGIILGQGSFEIGPDLLHVAELGLASPA